MNASTLEQQSLDDKLFVGFVYSFVTTIMLTPYCISLYIIKRDRSIYDYAFRLFALNMGCADMELLACMGVFPALAYLLPISIPFYVCKLQGALSANAWYTYAMLAQMMSLNRFVCVFWRTKAKSIYTKRNTLVIVAFCWIQGLIWTSFYLKPNVTLYFDFEQKGLTYDFTLSATATVFLANKIFNYMHVFSLCLIYAAIYLRIRLERMQISDRNVANDTKKERNILIQACIICAMDIAVVVTWAILPNFAKVKWALFIANIVVLSSSGSTGYMYLIMNSMVRQRFREMFLCCRYSKVLSITLSRCKADQEEYETKSSRTRIELEQCQFMDGDVLL